ncbi:MAG: (d)CMP kinase, partial [Mucinivorans sp.]
KSTFAKAIAARLGYVFIDTGAMYRAVTLYALRLGFLGAELEANLDSVHISFVFNAALARSEIYLNDENVDAAIRSVEVNNLVSAVASLPAVRTKLVDMQRQMGHRGGVVMDGRDIGTVVFPNANIKIFMTADPAIRARRRYDELKGTVPLLDIEKNVRDRDTADLTRAESPLCQAADAVVLDNSHLTPQDQIKWFFDTFSSIIKAHEFA